MSKKQSVKDNDVEVQSEQMGVGTTQDAEVESSKQTNQNKEEQIDVAALKKELEEVKEKAASNWDKLLRKEAEMQNIRRRSENELANAHKYGIERFAQELLAVVDSFEQALSLEINDKDRKASKAIFEGMELTYKQFLDVMEKFGIKQVNPEGEPFDPQFHEAISMQETEDAKPNHVLTVVQKGFIVHERVLRAAKVVIAKAKEPAPSEKDK